MIRLILKGVRGHFLRFLLTVVAVTLGVSLIAGTYVLTDSIGSTFDKLFNQVAKGLDVQVRGEKGGSSAEGGPDLRTPLPLSLADRLRAVDGVRRVAPDLQGFALLVGKDGTAVRSGGAPTFGFAYFPDDPTLKLVAGRAPSGPDQVAVESSTLERSKLAVGDRTGALIGGQPREVTIVGEVRFDAPLAGATIVLVDQPTAQSAFAPDGTVQSFSLNAQPGVSPDELRQRVAAVLPPHAEAVTGSVVAQENRDSIGTALKFIRIFLFIFAAVSLVVGAFIIFNTFSMLVAQRTRELALLRAVGASRGQVMRIVLGEAVVVGLAGAALGIAVGLALAAGLQAFFRVAIGLDISSGLPLLPHTIIWSLVIGIGVTAAAATFPAWRATRIAPVAAMRDDIAMPVHRLRVRGIIGLAMLVLGVGLLATAVSRRDVIWPLAGLGAALTGISAVVLAPLATRPVVRVVASPFVLLSHTVGKLARENALRNPRRTAATAAAFMIGLALMAAMSVVAQSTKASVSDLVARQLTADFVLNGGGQAQFPPTVAEAVAKLPDVASVATIGGISVQTGTQSAFAMAAEAQGIADNVRVDVTSGTLNSLDQGKILVDTSIAKSRHWQVGSTFPATVGALKNVPLTVGGVYKDNQVLNGQILLPRALYQRAVPAAQQGDFLVYVKAQPGADLASLRTALVGVVKPYIVVSVQDGKEFTASQADQVNTLLYLIYVLLALAVVIAVLGIINTLALSIFERTREIGLLRAVGLSRRQLSSIITIESVATAVFGALLGAALGVGLGIALQRGLVNQGLSVLAVPWLQLVLVLVFAAVAGVIAAVLPAIRAVRLDVLRAITTE